MANNTRRIQIRVTDEEYSELIRQKEFMKLTSYSDLIRMYINNNVCFNVDFSGLHEVSTQISRIGNNINQIAHAANETDSVTSNQVQELKELMKALEAEVARVTKEKARIVKYISRQSHGGGNLGSYEDYKSEG